jgi:hypothetical protein
MKCNPETGGIYTARNYTTAIQTKQVSAEAADISISERSLTQKASFSNNYIIYQ